MPEIKNVRFMPLSGKATEVKTEFDLPNKKIVVFNHRWNKSSGTERFLKYIENVSDDYVFWITDEKNCDVKRDNFIVKSLNYEDFNYLMNNCYCNVTFIDGYTTWNLSAQDCLVRNKPSLMFDNEIIDTVCQGKAYKFKSKQEIQSLLENLPKRIENYDIYLHDKLFKENLINSINESWECTKQVPKAAADFINLVKNKKVRTKKDILTLVHNGIISNGSNHGIRRYVLHNGLKDDITEPYPTYYLESEEIKKEVNLFNSF
jgi:hypothetical protein